MSGLSANAGSTIVLVSLCAVLVAFILVPVVLVFYESLTWEGQLTLRHYAVFFADPFYRQSFLNSLLVAVSSVAVSSLLGVPMAYILARYQLRGTSVLLTLATLPMIMPPFVGALAFKLLFGKHGTVNLLLMDNLGLKTPINFIYGLHGVILITSLHLYPLIMLNVMSSLSRLDRSLEESAENLGATSLYRFRTVTFPLMMPGFAAGALLVFIWAFSDLGTPLIVGIYDLIAPQAFFAVGEVYSEETIRLGVVMCVVMVGFSILALAAMRKYISLRQYATMTAIAPAKALAPPGRRLRYAANSFCLIVILVSLLPHLGIIIGSFSKIWSLTPLPTIYTMNNYKTILIDAPGFLYNTLRYGAVATLIDIILGAVIAYMVTRRRFPGRNLLDGITMLPFALPGVVIGIGYIRTFRNPFPFTNFELITTWMILAIALSMRRLPYTVRASHAAIQQVHVSLEEASMNLGADRLRTFARITIPLIVSGIMSGAILAFVNCVTELSVSWLLSLPGKGWEPMTVGIMVYSQTGQIGQSSAMGVLLIAIVAMCLMIVNKFTSGRAGMNIGG